MDISIPDLRSGKWWQPIEVPPKESFMFDPEEADGPMAGHFFRLFGWKGKLWPRFAVESFVFDSETFEVRVSSSYKTEPGEPWQKWGTPKRLRDTVIELTAELNTYLQKTYA